MSVVRALRVREARPEPCTQPADLDRQLSIRLLSTVGLRAHAPKVVAAASEDRQRAFTLLLRAYDELRRAASYLRWDDGDAEKLMPSLWQGRGKRRKKTAAVEPEATTEALHKFEGPTPDDASGQEQRSGEPSFMHAPPWHAPRT